MMRFSRDTSARKAMSFPSAMVECCSRATEQAFKSLYERGLVMPDGTVSQKLEKSEFQDLYSKGILALDGSGKAKIDKTVIYQGAIL